MIRIFFKFHYRHIGHIGWDPQGGYDVRKRFYVFKGGTKNLTTNEGGGGVDIR